MASGWIWSNPKKIEVVMKSIQSIIAKPETLTFVDSQCKKWVVRNWWCAIDTNLPICTIHIDRHILFLFKMAYWEKLEREANQYIHSNYWKLMIIFGAEHAQTHAHAQFIAGGVEMKINSRLPCKFVYMKTSKRDVEWERRG